MSQKKLVVKGSLLLLTGQVVGYGCSFVRNIILARMLTKADFGIAATFAMAVQLVDIAGKFSIGLQMVQAKEGDDERFMASAHLFQFLISSFSAIIMFAFAHVLASAFKIPHTVWAFQLLALLPLMKGFENLDVQRMMRDLDYKGVTWIEVISQIIVTLAAWPMCQWLPDYRSILFILIAKNAINLASTYIFAKRKYQWRWDNRYMRNMASFGWPLLINGFLMFGMMQGDRVIVAMGYTMADLGGYSVASQLTIIPGLMFVQIIGSIMLPILSRSQENKTEFYDKYKLAFRISGFFSTMFVVFMILFGGQLTVLFFGKKYMGLSAVLSWLAMANAFKLMRTAPAIAALALGDTKNNMYSNGVRTAGLLFSLLVIVLKMPLWSLAASCFAAEVCALIFSLCFLTSKYNIEIKYVYFPASLLTISTIVAGVFSYANGKNVGTGATAVVSISIFILVAVINVGLQKDLRAEAYRTFSGFINRKIR
jgi:Membrane protein involved in the export of O-antigen and teichoic acid